MPEMDLDLFAQTAGNIRKKAIAENRIRINPAEGELKSLAEQEPEVKKTIYGNLVAESEPSSRAAMFTKNSVDHAFAEEELELLKQCEKALGRENLVSIDRRVGSNSSKITVRLTLPERFAHVAYGGGHLFQPLEEEVAQTTYEILMFFDEAFEENKSKPLPRKDITIRLAMLEDGRVIKIVRNSNYIGEYKKGVFAAEDWAAKKRGGIFLHAGCREDYLQSVHGDYRTSRTLLVALTANGKTSTTSKILARKGREKSWLVQDDGGTLLPDGSFHGFEGGGLFAKAEGVNPGSQMEIFYGLLRPDTVCENVHVTEDSDLDFYNLERTSNGRAVIRREDIMHTSSYIDVDRIDNLILITRGPTIPAISQLTMEQAIALMIMGQAMESSAGDPTQAGKIRSVFFYDPFMVGDKVAHANKLYEILQNSPHMKYYLINTGGIGEGESYEDIRLEFTLAILDSLLRGGLEEWTKSASGFKVPQAVRHLDDIYLHPEKLYSRVEFEKRQKKLNGIRREVLEKMGGELPLNIRNAFKPA